MIQINDLLVSELTYHYITLLEHKLANDLLYLDPKFLSEVESHEIKRYLSHVESIMEHLIDWGLPIFSFSNCEMVIPALTAFHGIDESNLPNELQDSSEFLILHKRLRTVVKLHEKLIIYGWDEYNLRKLQNSIQQNTGKFEVISAILLADAISRMKEVESDPIYTERIKNTASIYFEVYETFAIEKGLYKLAKEHSDLAFKITNKVNYNELSKRRDQVYHSGKKISQEILTKIKNVWQGDVRVSFYQSHVSTIAKNLGVLHEQDNDVADNIIDTCQFWDIGRVKFDLVNSKDVFIVSGLLMNLFPNKNISIKNNFGSPKPSGYQGIHFKLSTWVAPKAKRYSLSNKNAQRAEKVSLKFAITPQNKSLTEWWIPLNQYTDKDIINIFTPHKDVISLPVDSSLADFAFSLHSDIGLQCKGGYVYSDGGERLFKEIDYILNDGETIELERDVDSPGPTQSWIDCCKTSRARNLIRKYIRAKKSPHRYSYKILVKIIAVDMPGLTNQISSVLSIRNLYSTFFKGEALGDGRGLFEFDLLLTVKERELYIKNNRLKNIFKDLDDSSILAITFRESYLSKDSWKLMNKKTPDDLNKYYAYFEGRRDEIRALRDWFFDERNRHIFAITGFYRAGKTTLASQFTNGLRDTLSVYLNCNHAMRVESEDELWLMLRDLVEDKCHDTYPWVERESADCSHPIKEFVKACRKISKFAWQSEKKKCLIVFDDIDVLDLPFGSMIQSLLYQIKVINDEMQFSTGSMIKFIFIGQYKLYRLLKKHEDKKRISHYPIRKTLSQQAIKKFIRKRLLLFTNEHPNHKYVLSLESYISNLIGYSPNHISIFLDLYISELAKMNPEKKLENQKYINIANSIFDEQINDMDGEVFYHLKTHYLEDEKNRRIRNVLALLCKAEGLGVKKQVFAGKIDLMEELTELIAFGFVTQSQNLEWAGIVDDWSSKYICRHLGINPDIKGK